MYRSELPASVARARELYKAVLYVHSAPPSISANWLGGPPPPDFRASTENPALIAQVSRAQQGLYQIDQGLNFFGFAADVLPSLRYQALRQEAERIAALAKSVEQDLIAFTESVERDAVDRLRAANMFTRARLQDMVAGQQARVADDQVTAASQQLRLAQEAVTNKQTEIADHNSIFGQFSDYFTGLSSMRLNSFNSRTSNF